MADYGSKSESSSGRVETGGVELNKADQESRVFEDSSHGQVESDPLIDGKGGSGRLITEAGGDSVIEDVIDTSKLAVPIFVAMLSWVGMKTTDSALLGHVSLEALSAAALSDLWTMCTAMLYQGRVLGILCGQAVGAGNPKLAGVYLQVSYVVLGIISLFVFVTWNVTKQVWLLLGQADTISADAGYYARVLSFAIPGQVAFSQLSQYFSSQRIMHPEVTSSTVALGLNLLLGLALVLGIPFPNFSGFGFVACPWITTMIVYIQLFFFWFVYCHIKGLHIPAWGGWSRQEITRERIRIFSELYFPAAFGNASDFWRVAVIGTIAAKLGEEEVGVFNTSYRIMWIVLILVGAIASAAGIKISMRLGKGDPLGARQAGNVGVTISIAVLLLISFAVYGQIRAFGLMFTSDEIFLDLFEQARLPFASTLFLMNLSVAIERIPISMGRTKEVFWMGFIASWLGQVPGVFLLTKYWRDDLVGLYTGMTVGYCFLVILYSLLAITSDWKKYSDIAIKRSEAKIANN